MLQQIDDIPPVATSSSSSSTATTATPDTQICVYSGTANAVMYTVPSGRKFRGYIGHQYGRQGNTYYLNITTGSTDVRYFGSLGAEPSNYKDTPMAILDLVAGTSIKNSSNGSRGYVFGVESDA